MKTKLITLALILLVLNVVLYGALFFLFGWQVMLAFFLGAFCAYLMLPFSERVMAKAFEAYYAE
jgi:hypothetical protein